MKKPIVTLEQVKEIEKTYPTPFHIYPTTATISFSACRTILTALSIIPLRTPR